MKKLLLVLSLVTTAQLAHATEDYPVFKCSLNSRTKITNKLTGESQLKLDSCKTSSGKSTFEINMFDTTLNSGVFYFPGCSNAVVDGSNPINWEIVNLKMLRKAPSNLDFQTITSTSSSAEAYVGADSRFGKSLPNEFDLNLVTNIESAIRKTSKTLQLACIKK